MSSATAIGVIVIGVVVLYAALILFGLKGAQRRTPTAITERMQAASEPIYVKVSPFEFAWNPITGRRDAVEKFRGAGWANYRLDEEGLVHFEFRHKTGRVVTEVGPPKVLPEPVSRARAKSGWIVAGVLGFYVVFALGGLILGTSLAPASSRGAAAAAGALLGWAAGYVVLVPVTLVLRARARQAGGTPAR